jgi:5-methylcytosine-specific restriction endonuclease McrA
MIFSDSAWFKVGSGSYRHYSGTTVERHGGLWTARAATGDSSKGHLTALDALLAMEKGFNSYWTLAPLESYAAEYGDVRHSIGPVERDLHLVFAFSLLKGEAFPEFMQRVFHKHLFNKARCSGCQLPMDDVRTRAIRQFDGMCGESKIHLTCACGYPVWRIEMHLYTAARRALDRTRLIAAEGRHGPSEMREILALQGGCCIYCNAKFTDGLRPSKDHLLPLTCHGSNWALNIVLACRSCNSSRGNIPFRTFCKLLSPAQNKRILMHVTRRLSALDSGRISKEGFDCLVKALANHDPKHPQYLSIQKIRVKARRNAEINRLLPGTIEDVLNRALAKTLPRPENTG